jgi:predicted HTH transcriptional regulator
MTTLARNTDPSTSHEAVERIEASGKRATHKESLLKAVQAVPRQTSAEYANLVGLERHEAARRLADLKNDGLVEQVDKRVCVVRGTKAMIWDTPK